VLRLVENTPLVHRQLGATALNLDEVHFKLTPTDLLGIVGTSATVWFVMRELPKEKNKYFKALGVGVMTFGLLGLFLALKHTLEKPKTIEKLIDEGKAEVKAPTPSPPPEWQDPNYI